MAKVAFIGDSFSAYWQAGQHKNHWSWKLAQKFPQHEYFNYGHGGRGHNYYQWCLLDAKLREVDIVFVSRTYNHRIGMLLNDCDFEFEEKTISDNYMTLKLDDDRYVWYSPSNWAFDGPFLSSEIEYWARERNLTVSQAKQLGNMLQYISMSITSQQYNDKWFENVSKLYNFKHIIPLELMNIMTGARSYKGSELLNSVAKNNAHHLLAQAHGVEDCENDFHMNKAGLLVSEEDSHWSPKANDWVLENFILTPDTVNILKDK